MCNVIAEFEFYFFFSYEAGSLKCAGLFLKRLKKIGILPASVTALSKGTCCFIQGTGQLGGTGVA